MSAIYKIAELDGSFSEIIADETFVQQYYPGRWTYVGPKPVIPLPPIITRFAMIERFSDAEYTGILTAAKTDVEVQGWLDRFYAANFVNLTDSRTVSGMNMLVSKGLLTKNRADQILTDPVRPEEQP